LFHQAELGGHDPHSSHRHRAESAACSAAENITDTRGSVHFRGPGDRLISILIRPDYSVGGGLGRGSGWVRGLRGRSQLSISIPVEPSAEVQLKRAQTDAVHDRWRRQANCPELQVAMSAAIVSLHAAFLRSRSRDTGTYANDNTAFGVWASMGRARWLRMRCGERWVTTRDAMVLRPVRRCGWRVGASRRRRRLRP
jgi:hypothetical protein